MMTTSSAAFSLEEQSLATIERKFEEKRKLAHEREEELFGIFRGELTGEERLALKFIYAYMPLNDLADYDGELFLKHVRTTLDIRNRVPWGNRVPDHLFLHFVLPYRVNNENIEDSRGILYEELSERVSHLSMEDAILETNHWCHEKATYIGNDVRTVSPMTLIRTALGRCGEQSTLAVAALRSLCIPARQCYTPRWAHSDSNHAWVEAWANGTWHYIGACEPEPRLNQGWFSGPARRAMLVNTRVPANYLGPEPLTLAHEWYSELNLLDTYAPVRNITVKVMDAAGTPIAGAMVWFHVYNYADFIPIAKLTANKNGEVAFRTGFGDLYVQAWQGDRRAEAKIRVGDGDVFPFVIDLKPHAEGILDLDMVPPPEIPDSEADLVSAEERALHNDRVQEGARIRKRFEDTFLNETQATGLAKELGLPAERVWPVIRKARGNSREIAAFLQEQTAEHGEWPLRLLESLNDKDLTDTFRTTLMDHLTGALPYRNDFEEHIFVSYILCPRVLFEMIRPYREYFQSTFTADQIERFRRSPAEWIRFLENKFEVIDDLSFYQGSATPAGSYRLKKGDGPSRDILFVASCRSFGIPARLHPSERTPQYWQNGVWQSAQFKAEEGVPNAKADSGKLLLLRDPDAADDMVASYYLNFSFARLENGVYKTLVYARNKTDVYDEPFEVESGSYRMIAGTRLKDGATLVRLTYFAVFPGKLTKLPLTFRKQSIDIPILGEVDCSWTFTISEDVSKPIGEWLNPKGTVLAWIEPDREPSKHLLREIGELAGRFELTGTKILFAVGDSGW
ncbi:MAG: transglutaminase, partial [Paenibacillus sp.]|nr:transglutaminase [Paenibacillus sp.]